MNYRQIEESGIFVDDIFFEKSFCNHLCNHESYGLWLYYLKRWNQLILNVLGETGLAETRNRLKQAIPRSKYNQYGSFEDT